MIVAFKNKHGDTFVGRVKRETKKLFYYVQLAGHSVELPLVKVTKSKCEILER